jgi:AcrR family transcriptional regulator
MMPRSYRLGERAAQKEATRERIIEAAIELCTELGVSGLTMRQVALRADVAPGTLRNHFRSREDLDMAIVERLTAEAPLPELSVFDGARTIEERLGRLIGVTGTFFDQSARLQRMWHRERMVTGVWAEAGATYGARWHDLMRLALGPLADDRDALAIIRGILDPAFFANVRSDTMTTEEVSTLITALISPWFAHREAVASVE